MILIYAKGEIVGVNADRFVFTDKTGEVRIYCKGDVAFVGTLKPLNEGLSLCDELVRGLKSEITAEFKEV